MNESGSDASRPEDVIRRALEALESFRSEFSEYYDESEHKDEIAALDVLLSERASRISMNQALNDQNGELMAEKRRLIGALERIVEIPSRRTLHLNAEAKAMHYIAEQTLAAAEREPEGGSHAVEA